MLIATKQTNQTNEWSLNNTRTYAYNMNHLLFIPKHLASIKYEHCLVSCSTNILMSVSVGGAPLNYSKLLAMNRNYEWGQIVGPLNTMSSYDKLYQPLPWTSGIGSGILGVALCVALEVHFLFFVEFYYASSFLASSSNFIIHHMCITVLYLLIISLSYNSMCEVNGTVAWSMPSALLHFVFYLI